jgi:hypothetical protein
MEDSTLYDAKTKFSQSPPNARMRRHSNKVDQATFNKVTNHLHKALEDQQRTQSTTDKQLVAE